MQPIFIAVACHERNIQLLGVTKDRAKAFNLIKQDFIGIFDLTENEFDEIAAASQNADMCDDTQLYFNVDELTAWGERLGNNHNWEVFSKKRIRA